MKIRHSAKIIIREVGKVCTNNILVTGGAGFVGSHLCERLSQDVKNNVVSLDNYFTGRVENHVSNVTYVTGHTEDIHKIPALMHIKFDHVYHLGEYSRVEQSFDDFELVWKYNILGTKEVLKFAKYNNAKLIYTGSSTKFVNHENYIQSPYAWSKASNTEFVKQFCNWHNMEYAITYFYNVYGKREIQEGKYSTLIAKYAKLMQMNKPLPVVLPGTQKRNFTHIDDIIDGLIIIGNHGNGDEYGIGNPTEYSVLEVTEMFGTNEIKYLEERRGNRMYAPVISKKTEALGWSPKRNLVEYIDKLKENGYSYE